MLYGKFENNRIRPTKGGVAFCPQCGQKLIPRCGFINIWHWAHESLNECDSWKEGESEWHRGWKMKYAPEYVEVPCGEHRADVKTDRLVVEFQKAGLSPEDIQKRENFYGKMAWVFFIKEENFYIRKKYAYGTYSFRWKHPRKTIWFCRKPVFLDCGDFVFLIKKIHAHTPCGGYGVTLSKESFVTFTKSGVMQLENTPKVATNMDGTIRTYPLKLDSLIDRRICSTTATENPFPKTL